MSFRTRDITNSSYLPDEQSLNSLTSFIRQDIENLESKIALLREKQESLNERRIDINERFSQDTSDEKALLEQEFNIKREEMEKKIKKLEETIQEYMREIERLRSEYKREYSILLQDYENRKREERMRLIEERQEKIKEIKDELDDLMNKKQSAEENLSKITKYKRVSEELRMPEGRELRMPEGRELRMPEGRELRMPEGRELRMPEGRELRMPEEDYVKNEMKLFGLERSSDGFYQINREFKNVKDDVSDFFTGVFDKFFMYHVFLPAPNLNNIYTSRIYQEKLVKRLLGKKYISLFEEYLLNVDRKYQVCHWYICFFFQFIQEKVVKDESKILDIYPEEITIEDLENPQSEFGINVFVKFLDISENFPPFELYKNEELIESFDELSMDYLFGLLFILNNREEYAIQLDLKPIHFRFLVDQYLTFEEPRNKKFCFTTNNNKDYYGFNSLDVLRGIKYATNLLNEKPSDYIKEVYERSLNTGKYSRMKIFTNK